MSATISTEKHWNKAQRDAAPPEHWAVPDKQKLRIDDSTHTKLAWDMVDRTIGLTDAEKKKARKRIQARAKELNIDTSKWKKFKGVSKEEFDNSVPTLGGSDCVSHLLVHAMTQAASLTAALGECKRDSMATGGEQSCLTGISAKVASLQAAIALLDEELVELGLPTVVPGEEQCKAVLDEHRSNLKDDFDIGRFYFVEEAPPEDDESTGDEG